MNNLDVPWQIRCLRVAFGDYAPSAGSPPDSSLLMKIDSTWPHRQPLATTRNTSKPLAPDGNISVWIRCRPSSPVMAPLESKYTWGKSSRSSIPAPRYFGTCELSLVAYTHTHTHTMHIDGKGGMKCFHASSQASKASSIIFSSMAFVSFTQS